MSIPHPIPYQGSKRRLAHEIISNFPAGAVRLIEPFAGSAAVSLAAASYGRAERFELSDSNAPLMALWEAIIARPHEIAEQYERLWHAQDGQEREYYDQVRTWFNSDQKPEYLLYLLARCVKASVRYNSNGEFNQSPDNRRKGAAPATMRHHIVRASRLLEGRTSVSAGDYRRALESAEPGDIVYMDPPYQGVCGERDQRYIGTVAFAEFAESLDALNRRRIAYVVSYDGRIGHTTYGQPLPASLKLTRMEVDAGRSTQASLLGRNHTTYESLYLSPALVARLDRQPSVGRRETQMALFQVTP